MLDFGWAELLIIVAVAIFVIGPKDIPNVMYSIGRIVRRIQYVRYAVSKQFDEIMDVGDLKELQKGVNFEAARNKGDEVSEAQFDNDYGEEPTDDVAAELNDITVGSNELDYGSEPTDDIAEELNNIDVGSNEVKKP